MKPDEPAGRLDEVVRSGAAFQEVPSPQASASLLDGNAPQSNRRCGSFEC